MTEGPPSDSAFANDSSSVDSALHFRNWTTKSVTKYCQMPPVSHHSIVIEEVPSADNQVHSSSIVDILSELVKEKNLNKLTSLGGVEKIGNSLIGTHWHCGIKGDAEEISRRTKDFGSNNSYGGKPPTKSFFCFVWKSFMNPIIVILLVCAALSLGLGIMVEEPNWYDSGSILLAVFLVFSFNVLGDFRQYKLSHTSNDILVDVLRDSKEHKISVSQIVVGDVVILKTGDRVPADGLFILGYSLVVDEPTVTGESVLLEVNCDPNPFLWSGSKVANGCGAMLVTSVGINTKWAENMSSSNSTSTDRFIVQAPLPLQERLKKLTLFKGMVGLAAGFLVLVVLLVLYFTGHKEDGNGNREFNGRNTKVDDLRKALVGIITAAVTIVVVATLEGLPSGVTLTLAYGMRRMKADHQAKFRNLSACETMGSATAICTDITSILLSNNLDVTKSFIGYEFMEERSYTSVAEDVLQLLAQGISLTRDNAYKLFAVTPMDEAIYEWAVRKLDLAMDNNTEGLSILAVESSCPEKKRMGILVKRQSNNMIHVHWKGDFERILSSCSHYYDNGGGIVALDDHDQLRQILADSGLRWIAFAHKRLSEEEYENERANKEIPDMNLILLGVVGLKGSYQPDTKQAIEISEEAGVKVKMITGESVSEAKATAIEYGILPHNPDDGMIVTGDEFRRYQGDERLEIVEQIRVLARSSPSDKLLMVQCLKDRGHVVAVMGDGTNDASALKAADIGLSMEIQGTEVEKENSDIIILDNKFASAAAVLGWGRCVHNNIKKLIQFQLIMSVAALAINFVAAVSTGETPLTPAQLLWVNLIMGTFGALAIATEEPTEELMNRPPANSLITNIMWRNILGQASYQIAMILALNFKATSIFGVHENVIDTLVFTTFVLLQVCNQFNARELEKKNVFKGILKNKLLLGITGIIIVLQVIMVEFLNKLAHTARLEWKQWGVSIGIAAFSWAIDGLVKFLPVPKGPMLNCPIIKNRDSGKSCFF